MKRTLFILAMILCSVMLSCKPNNEEENNNNYGSDNNNDTICVINGHGYVDLGLPSGLKWATCNVGASSPEEYGNYYAWGETETKTEYIEENYLLWEDEIMNLFVDISGNVDYDVANNKWGGTWRMPTKFEMEELINNCNWEWTTINGVDGYKATAINGNYIFFPAAGAGNPGSDLEIDIEDYEVDIYGGYWTSTPIYYDDDVNCLAFSASNVIMLWVDRDAGISIRPVSD